MEDLIRGHDEVLATLKDEHSNSLEEAKAAVASKDNDVDRLREELESLTVQTESLQNALETATNRLEEMAPLYAESEQYQKNLAELQVSYNTLTEEKNKEQQVLNTKLQEIAEQSANQEKALADKHKRELEALQESVRKEIEVCERLQYFFVLDLANQSLALERTSTKGQAIGRAT
jgi:chromosome segregation ATPase